MSKIKTLNYNPPAFIVWGADNCQTLTKFAHYQSKTRSPSYQCMYQVWLKSLDFYSSYHLETKIWASRTDNSVKIS